TKPVSARPRRKSARTSTESTGDLALKYPTTGIAGCCARAVSGHVAALPSAAINSRRPMLTGMCPSPREGCLVRNDTTPRACGLQIDDEIELGWLLDRNIARFRPTQNFVDVVGAAPEHVRLVWRIGHQT